MCSQIISCIEAEYHTIWRRIWKVSAFWSGWKTMPFRFRWHYFSFQIVVRTASAHASNIVGRRWGREIESGVMRGLANTRDMLPTKLLTKKILRTFPWQPLKIFPWCTATAVVISCIHQTNATTKQSLHFWLMPPPPPPNGLAAGEDINRAGDIVRINHMSASDSA